MKTGMLKLFTVLGPFPNEIKLIEGAKTNHNQQLFQEDLERKIVRFLLEKLPVTEGLKPGIAFLNDKLGGSGPMSNLEYWVQYNFDEIPPTSIGVDRKKARSYGCDGFEELQKSLNAISELWKGYATLRSQIVMNELSIDFILFQRND